MKVYISGPITANPDYEAEFQSAEDILTEAGLTVVNPVKITQHLLEKNLSPAELWKECMEIDLTELKKCDAIVLLDRKGLESQGVDIEIETAKEMCIPILHLISLD